MTFGNPALGTYGGSVVSLHNRCRTNPIDVIDLDLYENGDGNGEQDEVCSNSDDESSGSASSSGSFSSCSDVDVDLGHDNERIVVMTNVPAAHVPDGVINLVRSHRPFIEQIRIVIGLSPAEEMEQRRKRRIRKFSLTGNNADLNNITPIKGDIRQRSLTWACENEDDSAQVNNALAASSSATSLIVQLSDEINSNGHNLSKDARSSSFDDLALKQHDSGRKLSHCHKHILEEERNSSNSGNDTKSYLILFVLDSKDSAETFVSDLHRRPFTSLDESETCSVYHTVHVDGDDGVSLLGPLFASSTSPPSPNIQSLSTTSKQQLNKDDHHQCPVCLEKMSLDASSSILTTVCNHSFHINCLAQWQDSPCPVCRFDHSGLNEALSRCHICCNTVGNYVCLICGVISCAKGASQFPAIGQNIMEGVPSDQMPSRRGHAFQHYEETLHAYALDTETQHVFDFAGGGYVHRLLQNIDDGKIVEGTDPRLVEEAQIELLLGRNNSDEVCVPPLSALERSTIPTYSSSAEDDEAIHRKLEGFAGQYYTLLKSQLEQQRIYYEGRLEAFRREFENNTKAEQSISDLTSALKQQRHQLEQRCMTLKKKYKKVSDDSMFLKNMNETLETDKLVFRNQIAEAQSQLARAKEMTKMRLAPLEEKLSVLMLQLENGFDGRPAVK